jgi:hypothetical protein
MNELLKRADKFISFSDDLRLRTAEGDKLVADLAERVRELEGEGYARDIATGFYYWWHNQSGSNTQQGFAEYWRDLQMKIHGVTEEDIAETKFPPALEPYDFTNTDPEYDKQWHERYEQIAKNAQAGAVGEKVRKTFSALRELTKPKSGAEMVEGLQPVSPEAVPVITKHSHREPKAITLENLEKDWLSSTTCHRQRRTVHWVSDDGQWIVMKHHGHSEWVGGWNGNAYCGTRYELFRVGDEFPRRIDRSPYFTQEGRWSKASMEWVEKIMGGWRPDGFVETQ